MAWGYPSPKLHQAGFRWITVLTLTSPRTPVSHGNEYAQPKKVLANEALPKGLPRSDFFSALNRPRDGQAGCKNFRGETFDAE
jgi:hypothetical protein